MFALLLTGAAAGVYFYGGPIEGAPGIFLVFAGTGLLICPPQRKVEGILWVFLAGLIGCGGLSLLPQSWFSTPSWRQALHNLPIVLSQQVSLVPAETAFYLAIFSISGLLVLFGQAHPLRNRVLLFLATAGVTVCAAYASLAIYAEQTGWHYPFDGVATFGFFPNRNHTATFLLTGCMLALGILGVVGTQKKWGHGIIAAVGLAVCGSGLMIYSASRGGVILLIIGTLIWLLGLGNTRWSKPLLISSAGIFAAGMVLFFVSKGEARNRLIKQFGWESSVVVSGGANSSAPILGNPEPNLDARILIFKDTLRIIRDYPLTGVGFGGFRGAFHQYREAFQTLTESTHPESDWLMLAAEAGIPTLLLALAGGAVLLHRARSEMAHPYWPLRWGIISAALVAILHGAVDVPAHQLNLGWWIMVLAAMGLQVPSHEPTHPPVWQRMVFWVGGLAALSLGIFLIRAEWFGGTASPPEAARKAAKRIFDLSKEDKLEEAVVLSTAAIAQSPMAEGLYYQRGVLQLHFEDTDSEVDGLFAIQRALNPDWPQVPIQQGLAWISVDQTRATRLWLDAMERIRKIDQANQQGEKGTLATLENLLRQGEKYPQVQLGLYETSRKSLGLTLVWLKTVPAELAAGKFSEISLGEAFLTALTPSERKQFLRVWYEKGDRTALFQFAADHPDWADAMWPVTVRQMVDAKDFQGAVKTVQEHYQLDLSLPPSGSAKKLTMPDDRDNLLENFNYFWKAGNEITARRIIEEARLKADKIGRPAPEIWKISVGLAIAEGKWEVAWNHLQRFLRETGRETIP